MKKLVLMLAVFFVMLVVACDMFEDTADTTQGGGEGAVGIAEKMSGGTLGDADLDSGEVTDAGSTSSQERDPE